MWRQWKAQRVQVWTAKDTDFLNRASQVPHLEWRIRVLEFSSDDETKFRFFYHSERLFDRLVNVFRFNVTGLSLSIVARRSCRSTSIRG